MQNFCKRYVYSLLSLLVSLSYRSSVDWTGKHFFTGILKPQIFTYREFHPNMWFAYPAISEGRQTLAWIKTVQFCTQSVRFLQAEN